MTPNGSETTSTEDPYAARRRRMVQRQLERRGVDDRRVLDAMAAVPRERFVAEADRDRAYRDGALRIGEGQTISQPWIVACMAMLLQLRGGERVLEVGTGSGYAAAVLSRLCDRVITVERHPALAERAKQLLRGLGYANVDVRAGDGSLGVPEEAPFDGISVTASAAGEPPAALFEQLAPGGTLVCPVNRDGRELLMRFREGEEKAVVPVRFVPLGEDGSGSPRPAAWWCAASEGGHSWRWCSHARACWRCRRATPTKASPPPRPPGARCARRRGSRPSSSRSSATSATGTRA